MGKKIEIDIDDLMRVCNILDSLRVSLHHIGAVGGTQGKDKMHRAMDEYFTTTDYSQDGKTGVYNEIADCWFILVELIKKNIGREELKKQSKNKRIKYFELKKYD